MTDFRTGLTTALHAAVQMVSSMSVAYVLETIFPKLDPSSGNLNKPTHILAAEAYGQILASVFVTLELNRIIPFDTDPTSGMTYTYFLWENQPNLKNKLSVVTHRLGYYLLSLFTPSTSQPQGTSEE